MRKNSPRKWLHAILDLLPVILIPVFMVYSHRHTIDSYTVTEEVPNFKNFYQYVENGKPDNLVDYSTDIGNLSLVNGNLQLYDNDNERNVTLTKSLDFSVGANDKLYFSFDYYDNGELFTLDGTLADVVYFDNLGSESTLFHFSKIFDIDSSYTIDYLDFYIQKTDNVDFYFYLKDIQVFNLTTIFGSGNEPTKEVFESYLTQDYYNFGDNQVQVGTQLVTLDDTDIGSQFVYILYNTTNKYFNMNQVFNLNGFWNWININMFGGTAPVMANVIWNIIVYEFVVDLLFLFYAFFMFLIDFTENLLDKPFNKGR